MNDQNQASDDIESTDKEISAFKKFLIKIRSVLSRKVPENEIEISIKEGGKLKFYFKGQSDDLELVSSQKLLNRSIYLSNFCLLYTSPSPRD